MRKNILWTGLLCMLLSIQAHGQIYGEWVKNINTYELDDMVIVTAYKKGLPVGKYYVTGDDKLKIMKAIGDIQDVVKPEYIKADNGIVTIPLYSYLYSVAPLDSADSYEVAPFFRTKTNAYGNAFDWEGNFQAEIGGIVISADKKDSTVVYGTVGILEHDSRRDVFYRADSIFSYPYQYLRGEPVRGKEVATKVNKLRKELQGIEKYRTGFHYYGTPWKLEEDGEVQVNVYEKGICVRKGRISSEEMLPMVQDYLVSLQIDYTARGYFSSYRLKENKTIEGLDYLTAITMMENIYPAIKQDDCVEIVFPSYVRNFDIKGIIIQLNARNGRVFGLNDEQNIGEPYLFYNDGGDTRTFQKWIKKNVSWYYIYKKEQKQKGQ